MDTLSCYKNNICVCESRFVILALRKEKVSHEIDEEVTNLHTSDQAYIKRTLFTYCFLAEISE